MTFLYVASDRPGAGKTALCVTLAHVFGQSGTASPAGTESPADIGDLVSDASSILEQDSESSDIVITEASNDLSVREHAGIAKELDAKVIVVVAYRRDLDPSELTDWKNELGDSLIGFVINGRTRYLGNEATTVLSPAMKDAGLVNLGIIPEDRTLLGVTVGQIAEHLEGRFLINEERSDVLIETLMAWGFSLDPGEYTFALRDHKALIIRGDRPDIQMSALGSDMACLICTQGMEPIEYVRFEAEEEGTAVMIVEPTTLQVMDSLGTVQDRARFDHPRKLTRYTELVNQHLDLGVVKHHLGLAD